VNNLVLKQFAAEISALEMPNFIYWDLRSGGRILPEPGKNSPAYLYLCGARAQHNGLL